MLVCCMLSTSVTYASLIPAVCCCCLQCMLLQAQVGLFSWPVSSVHCRQHLHWFIVLSTYDLCNDDIHLEIMPLSSTYAPCSADSHRDSMTV